MLTSDKPAQAYYGLSSTVKLFVILGFVGLLVSLYLLSSKIFNLDPVCGITSCGIVNSSEYSYLLNIPISAWGVLFYLAVIAGGIEIGLIQTKRNSILFRLKHLLHLDIPEEQYYLVMKKLVFALTVTGVIFSSYLTYIEAFVIQAWCQWCLVSAWITICLLVLSLSFWKKELE